MPFNPDMTKEELSKIVPKPIVRFDHAFPAGSPICEMLNKRFTKPSPIQAQSWPIILSGHDMIGVAQTGTGIIIFSFDFLPKFYYFYFILFFFLLTLYNIFSIIN